MAYPYRHDAEVRLISEHFGKPEARRLEWWRENADGYQALEKALEMGPDAVIDEVKESGLRGRGGAGFPTGVKWSFMPKDTDKPHYFLLNSDESEPGTFKDRELMRWTPHQVVEGCLIAAYAIRSEHCYIYCRGEFFETTQILARAIEAELRPYDVKAFAPAAYPGKRHPVQDIVEKIRRIFLDMGFHEIGGHLARTAFWNLDALFIPQDHPAREMQDTFYLTEPRRVPLRGTGALADELDGDVVDAIGTVHRDGGETGSTGWGQAWSEEEASQVLLRTHTTVDTISHLARHPGAPQRIFEVGRVFRKERLDATHLPEFHQVEGIVVEEGANLDMLVGLLRTFYVKMGFEDVRVRPAYFPYTEPSLEVEALYNDEWLELGGAGIFRPEVTQPLGVEHPVLAWGLGLERLAMMVLGLEDIRELYMSDVDWLRNAPLV
jgi:phenylalanyl-tRNA synthetase alpha subunit